LILGKVQEVPKEIAGVGVARKIEMAQALLKANAAVNELNAAIKSAEVRKGRAGGDKVKVGECDEEITRYSGQMFAFLNEIRKFKFG
jgi:hypothetical protein